MICAQSGRALCINDLRLKWQGTFQVSITARHYYYTRKTKVCQQPFCSGPRKSSFNTPAGNITQTSSRDKAKGYESRGREKCAKKANHQNHPNFGGSKILYLFQEQCYAPSIRIIIEESTRQFNMILDNASLDEVSFLYNLIRFNAIFRTMFRVCCMFRFSMRQ